MNTWLKIWEPENPVFWNSTGKQVAWRTLTITTISLTLSFATWFMVSAIVTRLNGIGFNFSSSQLFWLAALPGLAAGTLRIIHTFLIPIFGSRHVISISTIIKLIPVLGLGFAVMDPNTPFWVFVVLSLTAGFGGGDFSSYMPSTNLFFPARLKGAALGIQAGIGNFGVSIAQFMTPMMLGVALYGAPQVLTLSNRAGESVSREIYLQSAAFWYAPLLIVVAVLCWFLLKSIPIKSSFKQQLEIFSKKHTWYCTIIYFMTFGTFAGLSAAFPLLLKSVYGQFDPGLDPLKYAFYGPLIGSAARVGFGFVADKTGGAILTTISGIGMFIVTVLIIFFNLLEPSGIDQMGLFIALMFLIFFFTGIGNASTFKQFPVIFKENPIHASGVIGWTAAIGAYGPFVFSMTISAFIGASGYATGFFWVLASFLIVATLINWYFYNRKGAEKPC
ncbi:MFS transporter, NNP family, nitrate/nitrite transporter [Algoriphagus alkaliphilus]|uniref:MFS transporter, NNP family, nitrate/nitrite transporter n=1 Tax=Algoriphagus alkaliphilus TaxID=279824 RepID=A0A1G5VT19_9BACT|nr:MFS transporter [Algoriphagus alkaliphilus]MBA4299279.1 MFS transporter [Cyclobacterium sp.]SDA48347.1 MFS transporter, NNP family, nitrate/nitrite transporter [Algoriphagus alkaliphilus]